MQKFLLLEGSLYITYFNPLTLKIGKSRIENRLFMQLLATPGHGACNGALLMITPVQLV